MPAAAETTAMPRRPPRFGDVWAIKGGVLGPEPWLIVSNDLYLELNEDNMLAVPNPRHQPVPVPGWSRNRSLT